MGRRLRPKYGTIKSYAWFGDGYLVVGFSQGYIVIISSQMREMSEDCAVYKCDLKTSKYRVILIA